MITPHPFKFDMEKAVEVILYIAQRAPIPDIYRICKVLYFADRYHLENYGRFICGDSYLAMKSGPVPQGVYATVNSVRQGKKDLNIEHAKNTFSVNGFKIIPTRPADLDLLSESDIECLDRAIREYGSVSFGRLKELSHDEAYEAADEDDVISIEDIARTLTNGDAIIEYLRDT